MKRIFLSKLIVSCLIGTIAITSTLPSVGVSANLRAKGIFNEYQSFISTTSVIIENEEALELFNELNNNAVRTRSFVEERVEYQGEFEDLNYLISSNDEDIEIIHNSGDNEVQSVILKNKNTNSHMLYEANKKTGELLLLIGNSKYKIVAEGENLNLYSESGEKLPILITEYDESAAVKPSIATTEEESNISTRSPWGKEYGPFTKTNKVLVDVIGTGGVAGSLITFIHPVLGIISTIAGAISWVGGLSYATLYIKYYQSYSVNDPTYVRQRDVYYQYSNHTGYVKERTWTFYSERPYTIGDITSK